MAEETAEEAAQRVNSKRNFSIKPTMAEAPNQQLVVLYMYAYIVLYMYAYTPTASSSIYVCMYVYVYFPSYCKKKYKTDGVIREKKMKRKKTHF